MFCILKLGEVEGEPAWDDPLIVVPVQFLKPVVEGCEKGVTLGFYPSMPHSLDTKEMIKDFVMKQSTPPDTWGAKKSVLVNAAATYEDALQLLAVAKAKQPKPSNNKRKKAIKNKVDKSVPPLANVAKKIRRDDQEQQSLSNQVAPETLRKSPTKKSCEVLVDISNTGNSDSEKSGENSTITSEVLYSSSVGAEPYEPLTTNQMKTILFTMPKELEQIAPLDGSGFSDVDLILGTSTPKIAPKESHYSQQNDSFEHPDLQNNEHVDSTPSTAQIQSEFPEQNVSPSPAKTHELSSTVSLEQIHMNVSYDAQINDSSYVIVSKKHLSEMEDRMVSRVSKAFGQVIDQKVVPKLDKMGLAINEVKGIASQQAETSVFTFDEFKQLYDFVLPLKTFEEFLRFDLAIQGLNHEKKVVEKYKHVSSNLKQHMRTTSSNLSSSEDNCKTIVRRFLENEVIVRFTAQRGKDKPHFNNTAFYTCLFDALLYVHTKDGKQTMSEDDLKTHLGTLINITRTLVGNAAKLNTASPSNASGSSQQTTVPTTD